MANAVKDKRQFQGTGALPECSGGFVGRNGADDPAEFCAPIFKANFGSIAGPAAPNRPAAPQAGAR